MSLRNVCLLPFLILVGCDELSSEGSLQSAESNNSVALEEEDIPATEIEGSSGEVCGESTVVEFLAGQHHDSGDIVVTNTEDELCVNFETEEGWFLEHTHLHIANDPSDFPLTGAGNPKIGNFDYQHELEMASSDEYCFTLADLGLATGDSIYIAAHAESVRTENGSVVQSETSWAEGTGFDGNSWAMYFDYTVQECEDVEEEDPVELSCETAFAFGEQTFVDLELTQNRWGWQLTVESGEAESTPIYAGAAHNDPERGTLVGYLNYSYDGQIFTASYDLDEGFGLDETHLYVGLENTDTISPGQYENIHEELEDASSDSFSVSIEGEQIYVVAHGVVCGEYPEEIEEEEETEEE